MRRGIRSAILIATMLTLLGLPTSSPAYLKEPYCGGFKPYGPITGIGVGTQFRVWYDAIIQSYEARCATAAAAGTTFYPGTNETTYQSMVARTTSARLDSFWGMDVPLTADQRLAIMTDAGGPQSGSQGGATSPVSHFPLYIDGIAIAYNVGCVPDGVRLSSAVLAQMYAGTVTRWNDATITALNTDMPGLASCNRTIKLTGRVDSSGTTLWFKDYLTKRNPNWLLYKAVKTWPSPLACRGLGDIGAAGCVAQNPGSVGYVPMNVAKSSGLKVARIERPDPLKGLEYVAPSAAGCTAAAAAMVFPPGFRTQDDWSLISLTDLPGGYPICHFNYSILLVWMEQGFLRQLSRAQAVSTRDLIATGLDDAVQNRIASFGYAKLPGNVLSIARAGLLDLQYSFCPLPRDVTREDQCSI